MNLKPTVMLFVFPSLLTACAVATPAAPTEIPTPTRVPVLLPTSTPEPFSQQDREAVSSWCENFRQIQDDMEPLEERYDQFVTEVDVATNALGTAVAEDATPTGGLPDPSKWASTARELSEQYESYLEPAGRLRRRPADLRDINDTLILRIEMMQEATRKIASYYETFEESHYDEASEALREANRTKRHLDDQVNDLLRKYRILPECTVVP